MPTSFVLRGKDRPNSKIFRLSVSESMMEKPTCNRCGGASVRNGKSTRGVQRYYCKGCRKNFQHDYSYLACSTGIDHKISSLTIESCGIRSVSRILGISTTTVIRRIKRIARHVTRPGFIFKGKEYEMDELWTYIGNKSRLYWVSYAICKETRRVIDFKVGRRTMGTLKRVLDTLLLSDARKIFTDGFGLYSYLIPAGIHRKGAYKINHIERKNLSIRTHIKRLSRKTICFSRSKEMLEACLKIYFWGTRDLCLQ